MFGDVLIVDDERDIYDLVAGVLEDEGYEARIAQDSDSALQGDYPSLSRNGAA